MNSITAQFSPPKISVLNHELDKSPLSKIEIVSIGPTFFHPVMAGQCLTIE